MIIIGIWKLFVNYRVFGLLYCYALWNLFVIPKNYKKFIVEMKRSEKFFFKNVA